jgi:dTDP-4-dehydrorhamnose 3,5-epimerase
LARGGAFTFEELMAITLTRMPIAGVWSVTPGKFADERGFFSETYNRQELSAAGLDGEFVQDNHSLSRRPGTLRGLHFQLEPFAQAKLVRVIRGAVLDVVVDLRRSSPTFGQHVSVVLSAEAWNQLLVPVGCAHGFCTTEPDTEVCYKVSAAYSREHDRGLRWDDPSLAIAWPLPEGGPVLSAKDARLPLLAELGPDQLFA